MTLRDLPPRWARLCLDIESFLTGELRLDLAGASVTVSFSGGADSTALLLVALHLAPRMGFSLKACHLDHGLRPSSGEEAKGAKGFCDSLDVPCKVEERDVAALAGDWSTGVEEAGRLARHDLLERTGADWFFLGHQLDDLCEDVLMRLIRGAGWPGLAGMEGVDPARRVVRPLLLTPKAQLMDFLTDMDIPWTEDPSNREPLCLRNRVRNGIMPLLLRENPGFGRAVARLWLQGHRDRLAAARAAPRLLDEGDRVFLSREELDGLGWSSLRTHVFKSVLDSLGPGQALAENLIRLDRAWTEDSTGAVIQFPGAKEAEVTRGGIEFRAGPGKENKCPRNPGLTHLRMASDGVWPKK